MRFTNLLWLAVIVGFALAQWVPGLLAVLCLFVMEAAIDLKAARAAAVKIASVFDTEPEPMTEARAEPMTEALMERVQLEMTAASMRRPH